MLGLIPRYSNALNEPNVSLKYFDIARLRLSTFCLEITDYFGRRLFWARPTLPHRMDPHGLRPSSPYTRV
jgi:hypothetical protein